MLVATFPKAGHVGNVKRTFWTSRAMMVRLQSKWLAGPSWMIRYWMRGGSEVELVARFANQSHLVKYEEKTNACVASTHTEDRGKKCCDPAMPVPHPSRSATHC